MRLVVRKRIGKPVSRRVVTNLLEIVSAVQDKLGALDDRTAAIMVGRILDEGRATMAVHQAGPYDVAPVVTGMMTFKPGRFA
jgi:hypothetical protein